MDLWLLFLIGCLATFRLTELVTCDLGPFRIFERLRNGTKFNRNLHELFTCEYCFSAYIALLITLITWRLYHMSWPAYVLWWAGIWGGAMTIYRLVRERC